VCRQISCVWGGGVAEQRYQWGGKGRGVQQEVERGLQQEGSLQAAVLPKLSCLVGWQQPSSIHHVVGCDVMGCPRRCYLAELPSLGETVRVSKNTMA